MQGWEMVKNGTWGGRDNEYRNAAENRPKLKKFLQNICGAKKQKTKKQWEITFGKKE